MFIIKARPSPADAQFSGAGLTNWKEDFEGKKKKMQKKSCCFAGHQLSKLPWGENEADPRCKALKFRLTQEVARAYQNGFRHFICGMSLGCDMYFGEAVLDLKRRYGDVILESAIPYEEQAAEWSNRQRDRYFHLAANCDIETMVQTGYTPDCLTRRNRYMVDCSSVLITVYNGQFGNTMHALAYAKRKKLKILPINLNDYAYECYGT